MSAIIDRAGLETADETLQSLQRVAAVRAIGDTPLLPVDAFRRASGLPETIDILLKTEWVNPGGSIKDRTALSIIRRAIADGHLGRGQALIDSTSGNTGIAYAMLGAALGIPVHLVVPESASRERKRTLAAYGATVTYSDPYEGSDGAIRLVRDLVDSEPGSFFYANQYGNPANIAAHRSTTGPEIWRQTGGELTHFVAALGTTGTLMGAGGYLREQGGATIIGVQPDEEFHGIEGLKHLPTAIVPAIYDPAMADRIMGIRTEAAFDASRLLARSEGLFAGSSTGANLAAAVELGRELAAAGDAATIVAVGCDGGSRYLSTGLWDIE
jgi:S-sulfo-L-cysteine synthase (O-acetyl-L-serine-dependent)